MSDLTPHQIEALLPALRERYDVARLVRPGGIGVELGVATGVFSQRVLERSQLKFLYSIDMYAGDRGHDVNQYKQAISRLDPYRDRNAVWRMRFDEAVDMFPDGHLDFIYVDGYAHTGEEEGDTFRGWWPKLRPGGIFAGDDYHPDWPLVIEQVDRFMAAHGLKPFIIDAAPDGQPHSLYPTWFVQKPMV